MRDVTGEEFYEFLRNKEFEIVQGRFTHEDTFIDKNTLGILAIRLSSSYGAPTRYQILINI